MNLKRPRDLKVHVDCAPMRVIPSGSGLKCGFGLGDCNEEPIEEQYGGAPGESILLCKTHAAQFRLLATCISEFTPDEFKRLEGLIDSKIGGKE